MTGSRLCHAIPTLVLLCLVILSAAHSVAGQDNQPIARRLLNRSTGPKYASFAKALEVAEGSGQFSILFAALDAAGLDIESAFAHGEELTTNYCSMHAQFELLQLRSICCISGSYLHGINAF